MHDPSLRRPTADRRSSAPGHRRDTVPRGEALAGRRSSAPGQRCDGGLPRREAPASAGGRSAASGQRCDGGLITLEWLLVVGAIAGLAASSVLIVQRVVDDTSEVPADPAVRLIDAEIAAAFVAAEANNDPNSMCSLWAGDPLVCYIISGEEDNSYEQRCTALRDTFNDVVSSSVWRSAQLDIDFINMEIPARCTVTPKEDRGG